MNKGGIFQTGTPDQLFLNPASPFVGYFIGSPGMNVMDCEMDDHGISVAGISYQISIEKFQNKIGTLKGYAIDEALKETLSWYRENSVKNKDL